MGGLWLIAHAPFHPGAAVPVEPLGHRLSLPARALGEGGTEGNGGGGEGEDQAHGG